MRAAYQGKPEVCTIFLNGVLFGMRLREMQLQYAALLPII
jgi:hypothetical protein